MQKKSLKKLKRKKKIAKVRSGIELVDKGAKKFWRKNFGKEKEIVTNADFSEKVYHHIRENRIQIYGKLGEDPDRKKFVDTCCERFFIIPDPSKYPDNKDIHNFIDKSAVQYAIHVFGPWIQIFTMFYNHFFILTTDSHPLDVFHGMLSDEETKKKLDKGNNKKSSKKMRYLLRIREDPEDKNINLVISTISRGRKKKIIYEDDKIIRKKFKAKQKKNDDSIPEPIPPKWAFTEKVAGVGNYTDQTTYFEKLENLLQYLLGNYTEDVKSRSTEKIKTAIWSDDYIKAKEIDVTKDSSEPRSEEEPKPMMKTMAIEEEETDEETLARLEKEEEAEMKRITDLEGEKKEN